MISISTQPAYPGTEIGEGDAEIVMATILIYLFCTTISGTHSQLGCQPTRPPELKQVAGNSDKGVQRYCVY